MYRLGLQTRSGKTALSRFPHTDKVALEKLVTILNRQFPNRKYIVAEEKANKIDFPKQKPIKFFEFHEAPKVLSKAA